MLAPIDWSRIQDAITTPRGWVELGMLVVCLGVAWLADRQMWRRRAAEEAGHHRVPGGFARLVFPLTAILLLLTARGFARHTGTTFFLDIALPLLVALAAIRIIVYALRRLFGNATWLTVSERSVAFIIWGLVVLHFTGALPEIADELDALTIPLGKTPLSVLTILKGIGAIGVTLVLTLWISGFLEQRVMSAHFDINMRVVLSKVIRAVLLILGVLVALDAIGFDLTLLTVFGGALGVGIGLGLQKLASNYIAGFTILLDNSIRMDDRVTVADRTGRVIRLTSRYVVIRATDGVEAIVPNETMVTSIVLNHSRTAPETRVIMTLQVTYASDVEAAMKIMQEVAAAQPRVQTTPSAPQVHLLGFGDNGYQLEMHLWIADPEKGQENLKSAINRSILKRFKDADIHIARPEREFRLVSPEAGTDLASAESTPADPTTG